jgi:hypothetical protein
MRKTWTRVEVFPIGGKAGTRKLTAYQSFSLLTSSGAASEALQKLIARKAAIIGEFPP